MDVRTALASVIDLARSHAERGGAPYAAGLLDGEGRWIVRGVNEVRRTGLTTRHAEMNVIEAAQRELDRVTLRGSTLVASTEPCPMCAGAIHWAGIPRVVFGLSIERLAAWQGDGGHQLVLPSREILSRSPGKPQVVGPLLEDDALAVHAAARARSGD